MGTGCSTMMPSEAAMGCLPGGGTNRSRACSCYGCAATTETLASRARRRQKRAMMEMNGRTVWS